MVKNFVGYEGCLRNPLTTKITKVLHKGLKELRFKIFLCELLLSFVYFVVKRIFICLLFISSINNYSAIKTDKKHPSILA